MRKIVAAKAIDWHSNSYSNTAAATATVTAAAATVAIPNAIAAPAMGTRMYIHRDKKNGWGRTCTSHGHADVHTQRQKERLGPHLFQYRPWTCTRPCSGSLTGSSLTFTSSPGVTDAMLSKFGPR